MVAVAVAVVLFSTTVSTSFHIGMGDVDVEVDVVVAVLAVATIFCFFFKLELFSFPLPEEAWGASVATETEVGVVLEEALERRLAAFSDDFSFLMDATETFVDVPTLLTLFGVAVCVSLLLLFVLEVLSLLLELEEHEASVDFRFFSPFTGTGLLLKVFGEIDLGCSGISGGVGEVDVDTETETAAPFVFCSPETEVPVLIEEELECLLKSDTEVPFEGDSSIEVEVDVLAVAVLLGF